MPLVYVFLGISLDGFIARTDGGIDFLEHLDAEIPENEDYGFGELMAKIDALVMGRHTFEKALTFPSWPYGSTKVFVLATKTVRIPDTLTKTVEVIGGEPKDVLAKLAKKGIKAIYLDGGNTVQRFLRARLVDEITITQLPVLIGNGIRLWGELDQDCWLTLKSSKAYPIGFVQSCYAAKRP